MIIEIKALDTLFFRDGKPFNSGENHWSDSVFPPNMSTIYGALRTAYFTENYDEFLRLNKKDFNTEKDPTKGLFINKLLFRIKDGKNDGYYYSMPLDLVKLKDIDDEETKDETKNKRYKVLPLRIKKNRDKNSHPLEKLLYFNDNVKVLKGGLIRGDKMCNYMNGIFEDTEICLTEDYIVDEPKIGIGINKSTKTSQDSMLYRIDLKRPKDLYLVIDFSGLKIKGKGAIKLGGESKYVSYKEIKVLPETYSLNRLPTINKGFKLTLMTAAIFEKGWLPKGVSEKNEFIMENDLFAIKLVAASIGKYALVGGYDIANNRPKPMVKAIPEGSTYYFEILKGKADDILKHFHLKSISDKLSNEGYGISIISKWGEVE